jgi:hypothetical protein
MQAFLPQQNCLLRHHGGHGIKGLHGTKAARILAMLIQRMAVRSDVLRTINKSYCGSNGRKAELQGAAWVKSNGTTLCRALTRSYPHPNLLGGSTETTKLVMY